MKDSADVIIVGAGTAGLTAAEMLSNSGLQIIILEARDRIGGRILTEFDPKAGFPIELGAEFIHGAPPNLLHRLQRGRVPIREIKGEPWCSEQRRLSPCGDFWERTERILEQMRYRKSSDSSFKSFLQGPKLRRFAAEDRTRATHYVEGFNAARAHEISVNSLVRSMRADEKIDGDRQFRVARGYDALLHSVHRRLAPDRVATQLNTLVSTIGWRQGQVKIVAQTPTRRLRTYIAARALITLPLGVLQARPRQAGAVQFQPALPEKERALQKLRMGKVMRVSLRFRRRFWDALRPGKGRKSLNKMTFLFSRDELFPTWWTAFPERWPILTGWSPSWWAQKLIGQPHSLIIREAVGALARILPVKRNDLANLLHSAYLHDWQSDPFARGAFSYALVGGDNAPAVLAKPVQNTLFFAGEATATDGHTGTVHGAIASAERAAGELLKSLTV